MIDEEIERLRSYVPDLTDSFNCSTIQSAQPGKPINILLRDTKGFPTLRKWGVLTRSEDGRKYNYSARKLNAADVDLGGGNWTEFLAVIDNASIPQR